MFVCLFVCLFFVFFFEGFYGKILGLCMKFGQKKENPKKVSFQLPKHKSNPRHIRSVPCTKTGKNEVSKQATEEVCCLLLMAGAFWRGWWFHLHTRTKNTTNPSRKRGKCVDSRKEIDGQSPYSDLWNVLGVMSVSGETKRGHLLGSWFGHPVLNSSHGHHHDDPGSGLRDPPPTGARR